MTEQEFERRSTDLAALVDFAHAGWMKHPASPKYRTRYEHALVLYVRGRQKLVTQYYADDRN